MRKVLVFGLVSALTILAACGQQSEQSVMSEQNDQSHSGENSYVVLGKDLQQLKDDFNANEGRVRLMFISGPTCGICLRGMADLNDAFLAASQNDDRLVTFVVHVPTLGAKEKHAADSIALLRGPRIHHYWEESGIIGSHYTEVMDVNMYVWDFWAIYGPEARWDRTLPPKPDYYEHQLGVSRGEFRGFPQKRVLDAERFAAETSKFLDRVDSSRFAKHADRELNEQELLADGTTIPVVAQPRNVAVSQHIRNRGGYRNLKRIQALEMRGNLEVEGRSYPLTVTMARPNLLSRSITNGDRTSVAELTADGELTIDTDVERGLPVALELKLLRTFEFDGRLVEWPDKGHQVSMSGMQKIGRVLSWKLDLVQSSGQHWHLFVNSHGGDIVMANMLDENERPEYSILQSDFRETSGFKYPHRIEYVNANGKSLGVEVIDEITIEEQAFDLANETVAH
ncbi:MAG: hypothetical protein ACE5OQ_05960 [Woeseia sp.]